MNLGRQSAVAAAVTAVLGAAPFSASAAIITADMEGWFTVLNQDASEALVNGDASGDGMFGRRTAVSGGLSLDTATGEGTGYLQGFSFFGGGMIGSSSITFQAIGDGAGGPGSLLLGNMGFNWSFSSAIPLSVVWDASGFFESIAGDLTTSDTVTGAGALPATDGYLFDFGGVSYTLPLGVSPIATTTWNTSDIGTVQFNDNPSGTLPLTNDGIGGSPMPTAPFPGFNFNFDFTSLHVTSVTSAVPLPAAVWLFGSGLLGLIGVARRRG